MLREKVQEQTIATNQQTQIQLGNPAGIYFINAITKEQIFTEKIVVQ